MKLISDYDLTVRTINVLGCEGIEYVEQLQEMTWAQLANMFTQNDNVKRKTVTELLEFIALLDNATSPRTFTLTYIHIDTNGTACATIDGECISSLYTVVSKHLQKQLTVRDIQQIATELAQLYYKPSVPVRNISVEQSNCLSHQLAMALFEYIATS